MKKAPLGLILFLYISLFSGSTQSLPQRSARMDSEWKEEKRGKIVDDAIIVEHENEHSSGSENGGPKKLILPFNRMAIRKRNVVSVDENGQAFPGTAETGGDNADLFRPLNEKRLIGGPPVRPPYGKRQVVSVDNDGQTFEGTAETGGDYADLFRPLPEKRQIVSEDTIPTRNEGLTTINLNPGHAVHYRVDKRKIVSVDGNGQSSPGTAETGGDHADLFRPLTKKKRQIVSVDEDGQSFDNSDLSLTPDIGNSPLFRPLPPAEKRYNSMMELTRLPAHKKRSEEDDCIINSSAAEWQLEKCCKRVFPDGLTSGRSRHNILFRACSNGNHL